jgi:hypothetical protein
MLESSFGGFKKRKHHLGTFEPKHSIFGGLNKINSFSIA